MNEAKKYSSLKMSRTPSIVNARSMTANIVNENKVYDEYRHWDATKVKYVIKEQFEGHKRDEIL